MTEIHMEDILRLPEAAALFLEKAEPGRVYAFEAPMGAGKTTFISELCRQLGCDDEASSPTFSIVNVYDSRRWGKVYHLDCYRLENEEEAFDIGVEDCFNSGHTCFVEWPENIPALLPPDTIWVRIAVADTGERILKADI